MAVTMEHLHEMLGRIERELAEARNAMAELTRTQKHDAEAWWQARMQQVRERNRQLEPVLNQVCQTLMNDAAPTGAEAVQQMMLVEGVRPESNLGSSGILDMREE